MIRVLGIIFLHIAAFGSIFYIYTKKNNKIKWQTILLQVMFLILSQISITGGYHRLWSHRSYEAHPILELFYLFFGTMATQSSVIQWVKEHRTHHRNEEKIGDPYNINEGLWHAHIGWLLKDHNIKTKQEIRKTDVSDLKNRTIFKIQDYYYILLWITISLIIPTLICMLWKDGKNGFFLNFIRIIVVLHMTWCVNSFAHYIGSKPYDKNLKASDNFFVSFITFGEGWHNYHHSNPKDYRCSPANKYNPTEWFINFTKLLGLSKNHKVKNKNINNDKFDLKNYKNIS